MPAIQHEYYIRQPSDTDARGPFTFAQLTELADTGGIDARTLYFDAASEQWIPLAGSDELGLLLKNKSGSSRARSSATGAPPVATTKPALILLVAGTLAFFISAYISARDTLVSIFSTPFFWIGVIDAVLALLLVAFSTKAFRFIRMRAALGFGFFVMLCWLQAILLGMLFGAVACICLWLATVFQTRRLITTNTIAGLAALAALTYYLVS